MICHGSESPSSDVVTGNTISLETILRTLFTSPPPRLSGTRSMDFQRQEMVSYGIPLAVRDDFAEIFNRVVYLD